MTPQVNDKIQIGIFEYGKLNLWCSVCYRERGTGIFQSYPQPVDVTRIAADVAAHEHTERKPGAT